MIIDSRSPSGEALDPLAGRDRHRDLAARDPFASVQPQQNVAEPTNDSTLILELCGIASCPFLVALTTTSQTPKSFLVILFFSRSHPSARAQGDRRGGERDDITCAWTGVLTEVSGQAGGDGVGGPFAVADVAVREGVQAKRLVPARELFVAAFGPVDGVDPLLELFGPVSYCGEGGWMHAKTRTVWWRG